MVRALRWRCAFRFAPLMCGACAFKVAAAPLQRVERAARALLVVARHALTFSAASAPSAATTSPTAIASPFASTAAAVAALATALTALDAAWRGAADGSDSASPRSALTATLAPIECGVTTLSDGRLVEAGRGGGLLARAIAAGDAPRHVALDDAALTTMQSDVRALAQHARARVRRRATRQPRAEFADDDRRGRR